MEIREIQDNNFKNIWNNFVIANSSPASFLQSWEFGDFCENNLNNKIFRLGVFEDNNLIAVAQFVQKKIFKNKFYLNCQKGPIVKFLMINDKFLNKIFNLLIYKLKNIKKSNIFLRIAPPYYGNFQDTVSNFQKPKILVNLKEPESSLILDLSKSEEELLKNMNQKTRYNIRLAERKGIKISKIQAPISKDNIDIFYNLMQQTAQRDRINIFSKKYYQNLLLITDYGLLITQFIAYHNNQPLAIIIVVGFGDTATYFYGASSDEQRNLMPNYLIQWHAIKWSRKNGYKFYDFWGINKNGWAGITRFKKGFGGKELNYVGTFDYVLNKKWYNLLRIVRFFKNISNPL